MSKKPPDIPDTFRNIAEAVKEFDVSRSTLQRALKAGKISYKTSTNGSQEKYLDPSDLAQKYEPRKNYDTGVKVSQDSDMIPHDIPSDTPVKIALLEQENGFLKKQVAELEADREERKQREKELQGIIENQTLALPKPESQPVSPQKTQSLSWQSVTLIGCGIVMTIALVFVAWVLPHLG